MSKKTSKAGILLLAVLMVAICVLSVLAVTKYFKTADLPGNSQLPTSSPKETETYKIDASSRIIPSEALLDVPHIYQLDKWPTGCESVSAVMALNFAGISISVDDFIDNYLTCTTPPFNPYKSFGGSPRDKGGLGCYAPVIKSALDGALKGSGKTARLLNGIPLEELCGEYIAGGIPVILWGTLDMAEPFEGKTWEFEGETFTWIRPEHCLLLIGYDDDNYIFCDPMHNENKTYYSKASVEKAYAALHSQAVVIK